MKRTLTLSALLWIFTLVSFGQEPGIRSTEKFKVPKPEQRFQAGKAIPNIYGVASLDLIEQQIDYSWDETSNQWVKGWRSEYTYDINGKNTLLINSIWNGTTWEERDKSEYLYDANGNQTQRLSYLWDETSSQWVNWSKDEYTYDANGNQTQFILYGWNASSQWEITGKYEYTYDANGNQTQWILYSWDETSSQWVAGAKDEYTYDANWNRTQCLWYLWDETFSQWWLRCEYRYEYTYDANGNQTQRIDYNDGSQYDKEEYTYDANGNLTHTVEYYWDETSSQWVEDYKYEFTYDANGNEAQCIEYQWGETSGQWEEYYKSIMSYSYIKTGMNPPENTNTVKVYPNPSKDFIYINTGTNYQNMTDHKIKITSPSGLLVFETFMDQQLFQINVHDLGQTGLYLIQIIDNSNNIIDTRKIVIQ